MRRLLVVIAPYYRRRIATSSMIPWMSSNLSSRVAAFEYRNSLRKRARGRYYRFQQPLWPSLEAMQKEEAKYLHQAPQPLKNLPDPRSKSTLLLEGQTPLNDVAIASGERQLDEFSQRQEIVGDLTSNEVGVTPWAHLGLDPLLSKLATERFGPLATKVQQRMILALIKEEHKDVLMNGVTGSGKTAGLILALLHGIRNETAGFNILVVKNTVLAFCAYDIVRSLCGDYGGKVVDRDVDDDSWILIAPLRQSVKNYFHLCKRSLTSSKGPVRLLISTADVLADLLFEKKMEFEEFGFLRRVYFDDAASQIDLLPQDALQADVRERLMEPTAAELVLGTLHQLPGPHIRSVMQIACASADLDSYLARYLQDLCIKPAAKTVILAATCLPSSLRCFFSFHLFKEKSTFHYLVRLMRNTTASIKGRAIVFVSSQLNLCDVRDELRKLTMDAKLFEDVHKNGSFSDDWRFLVLHESDAWGLDIPGVTQVYITFPPNDRNSYAHMVGRAARVGNIGWAFVVCDRRSAKDVHTVVSELDVNVASSTINETMEQVPPREIERLVKNASLYGMDPQFVTEAHYEAITENPNFTDVNRELWGRNKNKAFFKVDYSDPDINWQKFQNAKRLSRELRGNPNALVRMVERGLLNSSGKPTKELHKRLASVLDLTRNSF